MTTGNRTSVSGSQSPKERGDLGKQSPMGPSGSSQGRATKTGLQTRVNNQRPSSVGAKFIGGHQAYPPGAKITLSSPKESSRHVFNFQIAALPSLL